MSVQLEKALRTYWEAADFTMETDKYVDGWKVERPNFWVIQISIQGLRFNMARRMRVETWLKTSRVGRVTELGSAISSDIKRLVNAKDPKEAQSFVNVIGGELHGPGMDRAAAELLALDIPFSVQKGPLLLKTAGIKKGEWTKGKKRSLVPPMPILAKSTYAHLNRCLDQAYEEMVAAGAVDLTTGDDRDSPDWGHYTWRRLAADACQAVYARKECLPEDVDLLMGWRLKKWEKEMRLHYTDRGVRTSRAHLTEMI